MSSPIIKRRAKRTTRVVNKCSKQNHEEGEDLFLGVLIFVSCVANSLNRAIRGGSGTCASVSHKPGFFCGRCPSCSVLFFLEEKGPILMRNSQNYLTREAAKIA